MSKSLNLRITGAKRVDLAFFKDLPDGNLFIAEARKQIPFEIKRVYFINSLANPKAVRGMHAHRKLEQVMFCVTGSFMLHLDDGTNKQRIKLSDPSVGIWMRPMVWHTMKSFSYDCTILVLASDWFDEADYIRDYPEFLRVTRAR